MTNTIKTDKLYEYLTRFKKEIVIDRNNPDFEKITQFDSLKIDIIEEVIGYFLNCVDVFIENEEDGE